MKLQYLIIHSAINNLTKKGVLVAEHLHLTETWIIICPIPE